MLFAKSVLGESDFFRNFFFAFRLTMPGRHFGRLCSVVMQRIMKEVRRSYMNSSNARECTFAARGYSRGDFRSLYIPEELVRSCVHRAR